MSGAIVEGGRDLVFRAKLGFGRRIAVAVDDRQLAAVPAAADAPEAEIRRRYVTRQVRQRLHQQAFRERVLRAYREHCAICRLRHQELLEAAHIVADRDPEGEPRVSNGLALCKLHHAAFDCHIIGVSPDYHVEVRLDVVGGDRRPDAQARTSRIPRLEPAPSGARFAEARSPVP
jgi:predicted restriction endonuclease